MDAESQVDSEINFQKQKRLFSFLFSEPDPIPTNDERIELVNLFNPISMLFNWVDKILYIGYKRTIHQNDIPMLNERSKVETIYQRFNHYFNHYNDIAKKEYMDKNDGSIKGYVFPTSKVIITLLYALGSQQLIAITCCILSNVLIVVLPLLNKKMIIYVTERNLGINLGIGKGVGYAFGITGFLLVQFFLQNLFFFYSILSGAQTKGVLTKAILQKSFISDARTKHNFPPAKLTTMIGSDLAKLDLCMIFYPNIFAAPVTFAIAIVLLAINIGASTGVAIAVILFIAIFFVIFAGLMTKYRKDSIVFTEERINLIKEIVSSLKIIKFYSWEDSYTKSVTDARINESKKLVRLQFFRNAAFTAIIVLTPISSLSTFLVLYAIDNGKRTAANVFSSVSLLGTLALVFVQLPFAIGSTIDAIISLTRVFKFLVADESSIYDNIEINENNLPKDNDYDQTVINVNNGEFQWEIFDGETDEEKEIRLKKEAKEAKKKNKKAKKTGKEVDNNKEVEKSKIDDAKSETGSDLDKLNKKFQGLKDINLKIEKGEFIMVIGSIGTGKTSLLNALSGFMKRIDGSVTINGSLLLCATPWAQNATIRDNITFGLPFDDKKYQQTIFACAFNDDLKILPGGDLTEVGERGITLSGGQKSRLNLSRAVYADKDIILLDDVLSAVDARVGKHIMETAMMGLLKEKTRILATHQLSFLSYADRVIYLNGDGTIDIGTVDELNERNEGFKTLVSHKDRDDNDDDEGKADTETITEEKNEEIREINEELEETEHLQEEAKLSKVQSDIKEIDLNLRRDGKLIEDELSAQNAITWRVYKSIFKLGSGKFGPFIVVGLALLASVLNEFSTIFSTVWLSFWTENKFKNLSNGIYIAVYSCIAVAQVIFIFIQFNLYVKIIVVAARYLNIKAIQNILHVPMSFMDVTPTGRILNRFTKDTDASDNELIENVRLGLYLGFEAIGAIILSIIYMPWVALIVPFLALIAVFLTSYYQASARELKRLESVQRSLYLNNFSESLNGLDTIKAYNADSRFIKKNDEFVNKTNEAAILLNGVQRWVGLKINWVCIAYVLLLTLLFANGVFKLSASSVGLVLAYIIQLPDLLSSVIRFLTLAENDLTSYERVHEYAYDIPLEPSYHIAETRPEENWPSTGKIKFNNVSMRYREGLPKVLKNVSFEVESNKRIGICGRTGAGKSTIMSTLFRINELAEGEISIDDVDISKLGLHELRSKLSIIPQESILFSGNIRKNLDPFDEVDDSILWESLRRSGLIDSEVLEQVKLQTDSKNLHKFHLNSVVENEGSNFSLGEKQLIAFARALVRNSKILVLDEATSSVDYETDSKIQKTIVNEFNDCTILCIAHRLRTIINYDKILVLDQGEIKEFDTPWNLFNEEDSIFRLLCDKSKITADEFKNN